jgi:hypothetical protein
MVPPRILTASRFAMNSGNSRVQVGTGSGCEGHFVENTKSKVLKVALQKVEL